MLPALNTIKKPLQIKSAVMAANVKFDKFTLNTSSFVATLWAGWVQRCLQLLQEHIRRTKTQRAVFEKVTKNASKPDIELLVELQGLVDVVVTKRSG